MRVPPSLAPWRKVPPGSAPGLAAVLAAAARQVTGLQERLDERARGTFARWDAAGVPPSAWTISRVNVGLRLDATSMPRRRAGERTELRVSRAARRLASVSVRIRFVRPTRVVESLAHGGA